MIKLDDVICIKHMIVCADCLELDENLENCIYDRFSKWLDHKRKTNHSHKSHAVAIIASTEVEGPVQEYIHNFGNIE